jgi:hypothetical protein
MTGWGTAALTTGVGASVGGADCFSGGALAQAVASTEAASAAAAINAHDDGMRGVRFTVLEPAAISSA